MNQYFSIPVDPPVKLVISHGSVVNIDLMRDDKTGLGFASDDKVSQIPIVGFDIALSRANRQSLRYGSVQ